MQALKKLQDKEKRLKANEALFRNEMSAILNSMVNGKLDARINPEILPEGGLRTTSEEVNAIIDVVAGPLQVTSGYIDQIAKGVILPPSPPITRANIGSSATTSTASSDDERLAG